MGLGEGRRRGFALLALTVGVCLASSCATPPPVPPEGEDWRALRRVDLPAELVRVGWSEESYLTEDHPVLFGRVWIQMQPSGAPTKSIVKATNNAAGGVLVDNLSCYNAVRGAGKCALLLNPPDRCYLSIYGKSANPDLDAFQTIFVSCPAYVTLGR
jgi:hypothetical protein